MAITRVSTAADGTQADDFSTGPVLSADAGEVAFNSRGTNLVPGDTNGRDDVFVRDLATGAITRVSTAADGTQGNGGSANPSLSGDGTRVAFGSLADNLVTGDTNGVSDIFVKDVATGAITRVSTAADGTQADGASFRASLSADGSKVAFVSSASNLVSGDTNGTSDIFVKDVATGAVTRVSTAADGTQTNLASSDLVLSADGTKVAFTSAANNLVPGDTNDRDDVFVKDVATGAITRVSAAADGTQANDGSAGAALSADGSKVGFISFADNLVPGDTNGQADIFVKDVATGAITRVSTATDGTQSDGISFDRLSLSADGSKVAFRSNATNLVPGDTNGASDVFVKDLATGETTRVSAAADGTQGAGTSASPSLSADGSQVAFQSDAGNLVPGDTNNTFDVFVTDAPCYATGTRILTDKGEVAVEALAVGDAVVTAAGQRRPIRWIGRRTLDCARHPRPEAVWPVRVLAGAFGEGLPARDLWLSPDHAVRVTVLDDVLIPIKHLLNDATIAQVERESVTYWHVELDSHDILVAEGLPAESFLDTGVRAAFENAGAFTTLHPDFTPLTLDDFCLPLVQEGVIVDAVRVRLLARAAALGWSLTSEDDLHALVDGVAVRPDREGASARFAIPASAAEVRLVSRSFVPERVSVGAGDGRRLGVPLRGLSATDGLGVVRSLPIDHALLAEGTSFVQAHEGDRWRWTTGDALVPRALWAGCESAVILSVETAPDRGTMRAWVAPDRAASASAAESDRARHVA